MPSKREALTVTVIMALFLLLTSIFIGLRSEHLLMAVLYLVLFFAGLPTRKLAVALLPFAIFGISYDWMRICPNYEVNPIDVAGLYNLEKSLFGVMDNGLLVTPCEYFAAHNWPIADVFCRNLLPLLGSRSHPVRSLPVFQEGKKNLPSLCVSILVCQFDWFCRLLYSSGRSALVCHQLRFRTDIKHTG